MFDLTTIAVILLLLFSYWNANESWNRVLTAKYPRLKVENVEFKENGTHAHFSLAATVCLLLLLDGGSVFVGKVQVATASINGVIAALLLLLQGKGNVSLGGAVIGSRNT